jgi:hypothetical protein
VLTGFQQKTASLARQVSDPSNFTPAWSRAVGRCPFVENNGARGTALGRPVLGLLFPCLFQARPEGAFEGVVPIASGA